MSTTAVATISRKLPGELQRRILRCTLTAPREAGVQKVATAITPPTWSSPQT